MKLETLLEGCGAAILVMLPYAWPQLASDHMLLYHSMLPNRALAWGNLIDLACVSLLAALFFRYVENTRAAVQAVVWSLIAGKVAAILLRLLIISDWIGLVTLGRSVPVASGVAFAAPLLAGLALYRFRPQAYRAFVKGLRIVLLLVGFSGVWIVPELVHAGLAHQPADGFEDRAEDIKLPPEAAGAANRGPRIVWVLFDELSYDQLFDHPYHGMRFPAFDKLRGSSVVFEDLKPAGYYTEEVVPSFFLGSRIQELKSDLHGNAKVKFSGQSGWVDFRSQTTVFTAARKDGWTTGVVGWYNPYCRMLAGSLNSCFWHPADGQFGPTLMRSSVWQAVLLPLRSMFVRFNRYKLYRQAQAEGYNVLMQQAGDLIRNERIRFVFIHLPIPHPPGIYDRKTGQIRAGGTYLDNLALADRTLRELESELNATRSAPDTTLIVCSDHSWRVPMWRPTQGWTKEEEAASHGVFERRPVLMIHFPGQSSEAPIAQPFEEIRLHAILLKMLAGKMNSADELTAWVNSTAQAAQTAALTGAR